MINYELLVKFSSETLTELLLANALAPDSVVTAKRILKDEIEDLDSVVRVETLHDKIVGA